MKRFALPLIVAAQFCGTSVWFAGNAVLPELGGRLGLGAGAVAGVTSAVQLGFIGGALVFALLAVADRWSPVRVFGACALLAAAANAGPALGGAPSYASLLGARVVTGFFLAGVYPVGMKIAADHFAPERLGRALGWLVGALVLGTALPFGLRDFGGGLADWRAVLLGSSALAAAGGLLLAGLLGDGPLRRAGRGFRPGAVGALFRVAALRRAALGYFGHMWELYSFWAFVPLFLAGSSAWVIGVGAVGCVWAGWRSLGRGAARVARRSLAVSGGCGLLLPVVLLYGPEWGLWMLLLVWGFFVVADSPMFSTLVAAAAPAEGRGSALTIVNCLGFALTIVSVQAISGLVAVVGVWGYAALALGPLVGIWAGPRGGRTRGGRTRGGRKARPYGGGAS